jgi:K+-transporting ATPase ATPase A chain
MIEGGTQILPGGPAASQIAIKQLGTNGGGYFGVNSAHPLENPTPISNLLQTIAILLIPMGCVFLYGLITKSMRHAWVVFFVMLSLFLISYSVAYFSEIKGISIWEGKESRFHLAESTFWMTATTAASNGSVNSMHDSFSPLGGMVGMLQIMMGEVIFGGVGAGMYGMILFILATVFLCGLMIGRTPEIFGKKIQKEIIQWTFIGLLIPNLSILIFSALAISSQWGQNALTNLGPHGLSEVLYAFSSASGNNGSAFAGLGTNTIPYNLSLGFCMFLGRFGVIYSIFRISDYWLVAKKSDNREGSFRIDSFLFGCLLFMVLVILAGLSFFPVLSLGPILESFLVSKEILF